LEPGFKPNAMKEDGGETMQRQMALKELANTSSATSTYICRLKKVILFGAKVLGFRCMLK